MNWVCNNIRKQVIQEGPGDLLNEYVNKDEDDNYFLDDYFGDVIDNDDPLKLGRCKVKVYNLMVGSIPDSDLPWAIPDFGFIGSKVGNFTVPPVGTTVKVNFDHGDIYFPVYMAKGLNENSLPSTKDTDYPHNVILVEMDDGSHISLNRKASTIRIHHFSGSEIMIEKDGNISLHGKGKIYIDTAESVNIGNGSGYIVTSPTPGNIITQDGHVLNASETIRG